MKNKKPLLLTLALITISGSELNAAKRKKMPTAAQQAAKRRAAAARKKAAAARKKTPTTAAAKVDLTKITELPFYIKNNLAKTAKIDVYKGGPASETVAIAGRGEKIATFSLNSKTYKIVPQKMKINQTYLVKITPRGEKASAYYVRHHGLKNRAERNGIALAVQERARQMDLTTAALPKEKIIVPSVLSVKIWRVPQRFMPSWAQEVQPVTSPVDTPPAAQPEEPSIPEEPVDTTPTGTPEVSTGVVAEETVTIMPVGEPQTSTMK